MIAFKHTVSLRAAMMTFTIFMVFFLILNFTIASAMIQSNDFSDYEEIKQTENAQSTADIISLYLKFNGQQLNEAMKEIAGAVNRKTISNQIARLTEDFLGFSSVVFVNADDAARVDDSDSISVLKKQGLLQLVLKSNDNPSIGQLRGVIDFNGGGFLWDVICKPGSNRSALLDESNNVIFSTEMCDEIAPVQLVVITRGDAQWRGENVISGRSIIPGTHFSIVSYEPVLAVRDIFNRLMIKLAFAMIPLGTLGLILLWMLIDAITRPLHQLALEAEFPGGINAEARIRKVFAWYFEAKWIKRSLLSGIGKNQVQLDALQTKANNDPLTGTLNRRGAEQILRELSESCTPFSIIVLDIDDFKRVNDGYGHSMGDVVLQHMASAIKRVCKKEDTICRMGGEEFMIILPDIGNFNAFAIAERIRIRISQTVFPSVGSVTVSLGVASWRVHQEMIPDLLIRCDQLMYRAKDAGKNKAISETMP